MSTEDFELTEEMLEGVSGGEFAVTEEIFMDRLISSTKDRGETLDELISFVKKGVRGQSVPLVHRPVSYWPIRRAPHPRQMLSQLLYSFSGSSAVQPQKVQWTR
jgi:hypothetical protein